MFFALRRFSIGLLCLSTVIIVFAGCDTARIPARGDIQYARDASIERIRISALTEFVADSVHPGEVQLKVLLEFPDTSDSAAPVPRILRFELYRFYPLSSDPRGKRLMIWPERDLSEAKKADEHWKELLLGYEFYLPLDFTPGQGEKYILEATCFSGQNRCNDLFKVEVSTVEE